MFGSEILDAAIGLVVVFLLVSLVCSSVREAIETVFKHRASDLERGIRELLGEAGGKSLAAELYNQPLVYSLFRGDYNPQKTSNLPSYIPPETFSLALIDVVLKMSNENELTSALASLPDSHLKRALVPLFAAAGHNVVQFRRNIEGWYNASMDRVSGWYKRRTQIIIAAIGFSTAAVLNVDAIAIARYLNTNQTARAVLVAEAQARAQSSDTSDPMTFLTRQGGVPVGWIFSPQPNQTAADFNRDWRRAPVSARDWLLKVLGVLCTGFAVSLGAPFWFDVLNRFIVIRSTVKPQEKSREEPSKD